MGKTVRNKRVTDVANTRYEQTRDSPKRKALRKQLTEGLDVLQDTIIKLSGDRELEDRAQRRKFKQADRVNIVVNWLNTICESPSRLAAFRELANIVPVDHVGGGDDATSSEGSGSRRRSTRRATNSRYATRSTGRRPPTTAAASATNGAAAADQPVPMDSTPSASGNFEATFQQQQQHQHQQHQHQQHQQPPAFLPYLASADANQMVPDTAETESEGEDDASMFASTTTTTSGTKSPRFASLASLDITKPSSPQSQSALSATVITTTTTTTTTTTSSPKVGGLAHNHTSSTVRLGVTASPLKSLQSMLRELKPPANPTLVIETPPTELAMQYLFDSMATNAGEAALSAMSDFALV